MCEQVSWGVIEADSLQLRVITLGYICSCHALSFVRSLQCLRSTFTVRSGSWFRDSEPAASGLRSPDLGCPLLPALPASALRKATLLPMESSASALRKAPLLPTESSASATESSASAYGKLRLCLRRAPPFTSFLIVLSINLSSCN